MCEALPPATPDARAEREAAIDEGVRHDTDVDAILAGGEQVAVDAFLGTGFSADKPLRGRIASGVVALHALAARGSAIVAIDVPSGLDASTGVHVGAARAALTLTFGTMKRGQLVSRDLCGALVVLDIGLGVHVANAGEARLATDAWFRGALPRISADAHKGTRRKLAILGGAEEMSGAVILAARGALRSGAGMVKCVVAPESLAALQQGEPASMSAAWPESDEAFQASVSSWADALLIGPGLGRDRAREITERALRMFDGPVVLDADAINAFEGNAPALASLLRGRPALLTPHPVEFSRVSGLTAERVLAARFDAPAQLAARVGATVLLKGVPTVIAAPTGETIVVAEGTPILATGGSGDVLGGIAVTLLAQSGDPLLAGALAAFAHGRAAALLGVRQVRGHVLEDVLAALPDAWLVPPPERRAPVLAELPAVGEAM